jgi:hypothetical protein
VSHLLRAGEGAEGFGGTRRTAMSDDTASSEQDNEGLVQRTLDSLSRAMADLTTVRVITMIADSPVKVVNDAKNSERTVTEISLSGDHEAFVTEVNLVDGDLMAVVPSSYAEHQNVADLHAKNVARASKVVPENLEAAANAATALLRALRNEG